MSRDRVLAAALAAAILVLAAWVVGQPWGLRWDFANFYDTGHRILAGESRNLYDSRSDIEGNPPLGVMIYWGTPLGGLIYVPLALLPPRAAMVAFKIQNVVALIAALWILLVRYLRRVDTSPGHDTPRKIATFLALCLVFQPFWTIFLVGGQTTATVFLLLVLFLIAYVSGRDWLGAFLLSLVFLIKPGFAVMLASFLIARRFAFLARVAACLAVEGLLSILLFGWDLHAGFAAQLVRGAGLERLWLFNSSLAAFVKNFSLLWRGDPAPAGAALLARLAMLVRAGVVVGFAVAWRAASRDLPNEAAARTHLAFLSLLFFLLVSEIVWEHYVMVLFIPATYVLARRGRFSAGARGLVWAALLLSAGQNIGLALAIDRLVTVDAFREILAVGLYKSGPLLLTAVFLVRFHGELVRSHGPSSAGSASGGGARATLAAG
jgi:hypothetical protein